MKSVNKYLIIASAIGCIGLLSGCDTTEENENLIKMYGISPESYFNSTHNIQVAGELKMIRQLLQKQVALEEARYRASKKPNLLCEPGE